jgi:hypothetical protein
MGRGLTRERFHLQDWRNKAHAAIQSPRFHSLPEKTATVTFDWEKTRRCAIPNPEFRFPTSMAGLGSGVARTCQVPQH